MLHTYLRWLLPALLLTTAPALAQRTAAQTKKNRALARRPAKKPALVAASPQALIVSVGDTGKSMFVVPQVQLTIPAAAARINQYMIDAALGEDLEVLPDTLTAASGIRQALAEYETNGQSGFVRASYEVLYNDHFLLSMEFTAEYMGAYPSSSVRHATFDLRTGRLLQVRDLLADTLALRQRWQQSINRRIGAHLAALPASYPELDTAMLADVRQRLHWNDSTRTATLEANDPRFYDFALTPFGLTLYYDFGFPHVIQALQPESDYLFPYADLKAWLKPKGPLEFRR
ncbi:hypothetical protein [Hymenobacter canadensis]|uniref:DUF3298 domain-containing protein n=1 Tax=Hymenobacter canadensis TaxID=2999067 RepID=A0ABY7LQQ0_9BACT|nr:hypothetical protein [Hymenobacter canadensis]WBA42741.1 hypothetical protein O3303_04085 [Hymenobacter canadensis]